MSSIVSVTGLRKTYAGGFQALKGVDLEIAEGEVLALLGPNGAGKTTLISTICGISTITEGAITVGGHDVVRDFRAARNMIGLVPQELHVEGFESVFSTVRFTRGLFGKRRDDALIEQILRDLALWDKRDERIMALSGGMKRRVMIAKALAHEPRILFLDEPTAGVDVELRQSMWEVMRGLKARGVTIILTTHYIEEAEAMADRVGVINKGELLLVEETGTLMRQMGKKTLTVELGAPLEALPPALARDGIVLGPDGASLIYSYDTAARQTGITDLLADIRGAGLQMVDLHTTQSSLEDIFVGLVKGGRR
ncbi:ABC transporter ATP-binding protein [Sinisalibacter aestuarii]|uniref:ABC transporter ATP-binding protein n=1 Tax=Sinisalibacter aestuarii TaxID=2949426 RepID=A0ABQ5LRM3_9RHOB|nr:ABC transporter ATP-binding protein [Sinisalibacter aestuarii]GKY86737.1 ABC transporter ATP-binding protein [Sinisalibacter aestuarii]